MSEEYAQLVYIPPDLWHNELEALEEKARLSLRRLRKSQIEDRRELARYDSLSRLIEQEARKLVAEELASVETLIVRADQPLLNAEGAAWTRDSGSLHPDARATAERLASGGGAVVELRGPANEAGGFQDEALPGVIPPSTPWRPPRNVQGKSATAARWENQIERALSSPTEPIVPSGISHEVISEGLRKYVQKAPSSDSTLVRVVYQDGSEARRFPLGSIDLQDQCGEEFISKRFALISLRHPEMDMEVEAAWFRNRDMSQVRPAAETDEVAYQLSRDTLAKIAGHGKYNIALYQTGLQPANMGFYRAVVEHLRDHPGSIAISPRYYRKRTDSYEEGTPWSSK